MYKYKHMSKWKEFWCGLKYRPPGSIQGAGQRGFGQLAGKLNNFAIKAGLCVVLLTNELTIKSSDAGLCFLSNLNNLSASLGQKRQQIKKDWGAGSIQKPNSGMLYSVMKIHAFPVKSVRDTM